MNVACFLQNRLFAILDLTKCKIKWLLFCLSLFVVGAICGIAIGCVSDDGWWFANRLSYVERIIEDGAFFAVLFQSLLTNLLLSLLLCLASFSFINYAKFALCAVCGLYCGIHAALAVRFFFFPVRTVPLYVRL